MVFDLKTHRWLTIGTLIMLGQWNFLVLLGAWIGSCIPDADTPYSSSIWCKIMPLWWLGGKNRFKVHRKVSHSWYSMLFFSCLAWVVSPGFGCGVFIGYFMHIWADSTTMVGVPYVFWPFKFNKNHPYFTGEMFKKEGIKEGA